jgi:dTDP-4-amino-4,6-dideoxygalactose transaminase
MLALHGGPPYRDTESRPFPARTPFGDEEIRLVTKALRSQNLFRWGGELTPLFESRFAEVYGARHAIGSTSGTAALHVAIGAVNPEPGDEIITSAITDLGTIIPILYQNAVPVFADTDPETLTVDPEDVERLITPRTRAIIAIHLFGNACRMEALAEIASRRAIPLIEDCCQAHLTCYRGRLLGTFGDIGCFSFQQSKHMTTGDGGMTITNDDALGRCMRGFADKHYDRDRAGSRMYGPLGMNCRITELHSAVGLAQLEKVGQVVASRNRLGGRLSEGVKHLDGIVAAPVTPGATHSYWSYPMRVTGYSTETFARALNAEGIGASAGYIGDPIFQCSAALAEHRTYGNSRFPFFSPYTERTFEHADELCPRTRELLGQLVMLSFNEQYTDRDIDDVAGAVRKVASALERTR